MVGKNLAVALALLVVPHAAAFADTEYFAVMYGGRNIGHLTAQTHGDQISVDYDFKNNGRGPTVTENIHLGADGLPTEWTIAGTTEFSGKVAEHFSLSGSRAQWSDSTGKGSAPIRKRSIYVAQSASPWSDGMYARALLKVVNLQMPAWPAGVLRLERGETLSVLGSAGSIQVTRYDLSGINLAPETILLDGNGALFANVSSREILVRAGYEEEAERLLKLAGEWSNQRVVNIQSEVVHHYPGPVRITNVRLFDPHTLSLQGPVAVLVRGKEISAIEPLGSPPTPDEVTIDGAGGTLVAGMYEMHAHLRRSDSALLNLLAGITTVRDMGNDNAVLDRLIQQIEDGVVGGPHVVRSGFIEGKSAFSNSMGILVDSQDRALDAVRWYGARGYWQIKIYNSVHPEWVPAMAKEAHLLGMRVAGHIPALATTDQMIEAGYDEITHIDKFMYGWVSEPGEDMRPITQRLVITRRLADLDLRRAARCSTPSG